MFKSNSWHKPLKDRMIWSTYDSLRKWGKFRPTKGLDTFLYLSPDIPLVEQLRLNGGYYFYRTLFTDDIKWIVIKYRRLVYRLEDK